MADFASIDEALDPLRPMLRVETDTEHDVIAELRGHLEESVAGAVARGAGPAQALDDAIDALGLTETATELRNIHLGLGVRDGMLAAAVPVVLALTFRWLAYAPDGTAAGWRVLVQPVVVGLLCGLGMIAVALRFPLRCTAIASCAFFAGMSPVTTLWPGLRW